VFGRIRGSEIMVKAINTVTGIYGWKGAGKTVVQTLFLWLEYQMKKKPVIYCNYKLDFPYEWLHGDDIVMIAEHLQNSAIGIDELHEYADCRNSGSVQNRRVSDFFLQSRHTNANVYYTTQYKDQVDKRIRRITDVDIVCENLETDSDGDGHNDLFRLTIKDRRRPESPVITKTICGTPIFNMYDSTERINPFEMKKRSKDNGED